MKEKQIQELIQIEDILDFNKKLVELFPNGLDMERVDKRIPKRLKELLAKKDKYNDIQKPIQLKTKGTNK